MRDDVPVRSDLLSATAPTDWLVIGWFTPDYRPLAERFTANLAEHGAPFHLWAKPMSKSWNTSQKPSVVLEAMDAYPGKTLVLMDVDCIVRGDIGPVAKVNGDVGIAVLAHNMRSRDAAHPYVGVECSSRVVVFRPTAGARHFAQQWARQIDRGIKHDECAMVWAFLSCPGVSFAYIAQAYSGREISLLPEAVICHDSAHSKQKPLPSSLPKMLKMIERLFRSGRTKARKLQREMSVLLKA